MLLRTHHGSIRQSTMIIVYLDGLLVLLEGSKHRWHSVHADTESGSEQLRSNIYMFAGVIKSIT